ncbi:MAG: DNA-binding response regulator, partial [Gemmatimonadaceae bacterium]|nr:DNA-binding response regulator [Gemmatimonadaceae bacterium]
MNILVVDDELGLRHTLTLILQAEGHEVRAAPNAASALERLAE